MENTKEKLLILPLEELELSLECLTNLKSMSIHCLQDFITRSWKGLRESQEFDYKYFNEVIKLLDKNGLLHVMEKR